MSKQTAQLLRTVPRFAEPFGRTYGWDCYSAYASCNGDLFSRQTYCHTGFTGTGIVIDPELDCSVILLTKKEPVGSFFVFFFCCLIIFR